MHILKCKICKKKIEHQEVLISDTLPDHIKVLECRGCGFLSVKAIKVEK